MKKEEFVKLFSENLRKALKETLTKMRADTIERFVKTCYYSFNEMINEYSEINENNFATISKKYLEKLNQLVANKQQHDLGIKVHWLDNDVAKIAADTLEKTFNEQIKKKVANSAIAKPSVKPAPPSMLPKELLPKEWNDSTPFAEHDHSFDSKIFSEKDMATLQFASNACAFPKLALYLERKHNINAHTTATEINRVLNAKTVNDSVVKSTNASSTKITLTATEVLTSFKKFKP